MKIGALVVGIAAVAFGLSVAGPAWGKTLFIANYNGSSINADYAVGSNGALPVYSPPGTTSSGRFGGGLDLTDVNRNITYPATGNLDPRRGTVDFWFCLDEDAPDMYHPLFGWYNPPSQPGSKKVMNALYVYTQGNSIILSVVTPDETGPNNTLGSVSLEKGRWYHLEINWDCTVGNSEYNVYLDGRNVITTIGREAWNISGDYRQTQEKPGALTLEGGFLHIGIWDYAWGHFLHGRVDELRITDQVEHTGEFIPSLVEYTIPATNSGVVALHRQAVADLKGLQEDLDILGRAIQLTRRNADVSQALQVEKSSKSLVGQSGWLLKEIVKKLQPGSDWTRLQKELDEPADLIKSARLAVAKATGSLYAMMPDIYNETVVNLGYLDDEREGLTRAIFYAKAVIPPDRKIINAEKSAQVAGQSGIAISNATKMLEDICEHFYGMFEDSPGLRKAPVAALHHFRIDPDKRQTIETIFNNLSETAVFVARTRSAIGEEFQRLKTDPVFAAAFPGYRKYVPAQLPPVNVAPDGRLERLIFAGAHGRVETMLSLGFDTLNEDGLDVSWVTRDNFEVKESKRMAAQWEKFKVPFSDTTCPIYAIGAGMYRPPWFNTEENLSYYLDPVQPSTGGGGLEYNHPAVREMIQEYLEEAARLSGQLPYSFVYKGPWEAHPYRGWSVLVPGKRTVAFAEYGFSEFAVKAFRAYLGKKFGNISELNNAWRSSYGSFDDIQPPEPLVMAFIVTKDERGQDFYSPFWPTKRWPATPLTYEFERCRKDLYADYLADCYQAIKRGDPKHPVASSQSGGTMDEQLIRSIDDLQMVERCVDMWGKHPSGGYGWDDSPYMWGLNRYFNKTLVSLEYYGWAQEEIGNDFWPTWQLAPGTTNRLVYNAGRRDVWHELSWNRRMLLFYWTQKLVEMRSGVTESVSPLVRMYASFIPVVKRRATDVNDIFIQIPVVEPRIALLHPGVSIINAYPTDACRFITRDILNRLISKQYHFGVVPEEFIVNGRDSLDNYDVVILPYVQYFDDGFGKMLLDWVNRGGTLISAGPFGLYDKYGFDIQDGAKKVFPNLRFSYPVPDQYTESWKWEAERDRKNISEQYLVAAHGRGTVLLTLDGRAFQLTGSLTAAAYVGTEIGAKIEGNDAPAKTANEPGKKPDDLARPLILEADSDLSPWVRALYEVMDKASKRKAWVAQGNVEMVLRRKKEGGDLYISLLNWNYRNPLETEVFVRGEYRGITDLSISGGFPVPAVVEGGLTKFPIILGPGEGVMLRLENTMNGGESLLPMAPELPERN